MFLRKYEDNSGPGGLAGVRPGYVIRMETIGQTVVITVLYSQVMHYLSFESVMILESAFVMIFLKSKIYVSLSQTRNNQPKKVAERF